MVESATVSDAAKIRNAAAVSAGRVLLLAMVQQTVMGMNVHMPPPLPAELSAMVESVIV